MTIGSADYLRFNIVALVISQTICALETRVHLKIGQVKKHRTYLSSFFKEQVSPKLSPLTTNLHQSLVCCVPQSCW